MKMHSCMSRTCLLMSTVMMATQADARPAKLSTLGVASPSGKIAAEIRSTDDGRIRLNVQLNGRPILTNGDLGITIDAIDLGSTVVLPDTIETKSKNEPYPVFGGHSTASNRWVESQINLTSGKSTWLIELRVYDDGVAYRYRVPGEGKRKVIGESSSWAVPEGATAFFQAHNSRKDYETPWQRATLPELTDRLTPKPPAPSTRPTPPPQPAMTLAAPVLFQLGDNAGYVMLTEANLVNYSDMGLRFDGRQSFKAFFHNEPDGFELEGEIVSPWRVAVISENLNGLVNTDLIRNVCPAPTEALANADWIKPGRSTWHWMVSGRPAFADQKKWVDWTRDLSFEYYLIDDGWKRWNDSGRDMWACMKEITDYAAQNNVGIWAWVDSKDILTHETRKAYFEKAASIGIKGVKIDFMKPANADWVKWYDETIKDAGDAKVMLNFHGSLRPSGRERTYPHEMTRESVRGREMGKQQGLHDTILPFVRMVQGPTDYTPTDFRTSATDPKLEKLKGSSFAHELSMAIVFTSPFFCYGGAPANYLENPAVDILKSIPATWDETIVLPGTDIGEVAAFARRKGDTWFVGVLNGSTPRTMPISLSFLKDGNYIIDKLADAPDRHDAFARSQSTITNKETLSVDLRKDGGFVARVTRQ